MPLAAGTRLGLYEVIAPIGKGGMGEVYRARHTKLDRDVAIKVLPDELANDEERVARFEREAKLLASLNHPNIASIYGFEEKSLQPERSAKRSGVAEREVVGVGPRDTIRCLVLELVEGPTLAERIQEGPIPVDDAIAIAKQIAEALEAGHEAGILHRDLKPANIKLKEDGTVKVLDYGLAKALESDAPARADSELSQSPTLTRQGTQMGVILGTAAYMSPEQAKGKRVDKRTDIWAFGAVLYEMLTGKRAFAAGDVSDTLAYVLTREPDWEALPVKTPSTLRQVLSVCLTKDVKRRARDIGDVRLAMEGAFGATVSPEHAGSRNAFPAWTPDGTRISYVSGETTGSMSLFWKRADGTGAAEQLLGGEVNLRNGSWAPDGQRTAFYDMTPTDRDIRVLPLGGDPEPFLVTRFNERIPMFSPNGLWLAYVSDESGRDEVYVARYPGPGGKQLVSTEGGTEPQWSRDGRELFYRQGSQLMAVPVSAGSDFRAGTPQALFEGYETDPNGITNYDVSPDGERFLMIQGEAGTLTKIIVVQNWTEELKRLVPTEK